MVFEVDALADTPIGRMVVDCLERRPDDPFAEMERETGFNPAEALDRVGVADDLVVMGGDFAGVVDSPMFQELERTQRGGAVVFSSADGEGQFALWGDEMLIAADDADALDEAIGLLAGDVPFDEGALPEADAYGEIYGSLDVDDAMGMFGDADLARRFGEAAEEVKIHVDASEDVAIVADVSGGESAALSDLGRALGGAMSLARLKARAEDEDDLAELLDFASVNNAGGALKVEVALPLEFLERHLADCKWAGEGGIGVNRVQPRLPVGGGTVGSAGSECVCCSERDGPGRDPMPRGLGRGRWG